MTGEVPPDEDAREPVEDATGQDDAGLEPEEQTGAETPSTSAEDSVAEPDAESDSDAAAQGDMSDAPADEPDEAGEPEEPGEDTPSASSRAARVSWRNRGSDRGAAEPDEVPYIDDRVSKVWVLLIVGVFVAILFYGLLFGKAGMLSPRTPEPTDTPVASATPIVTLSPAPSASSTPSSAPTITLAPSAAASGSPTTSTAGPTATPSAGST